MITFWTFAGIALLVLTVVNAFRIVDIAVDKNSPWFVLTAAFMVFVSGIGVIFGVVEFSCYWFIGLALLAHCGIWAYLSYYKRYVKAQKRNTWFD